jgi:hypothetical protein
VKFLADTDISPKTVAFLLSLGHDAVHLSEQGLERLPDPGIVEKARQEERIMLVHDLALGSWSPRVAPGCPVYVNGALQSIISEHAEALERGAMISVTESQVRVRRLPLSP